ncbi:MAG: hypothetical protein P8L85_13045, partial [Rubripirellula sp.]|nr:hypothetical protein [Rubripirellula sp.]
GEIGLSATNDITVNAEIDPTTVTLHSGDDILIHASVMASDLIELSAGEDGTGGIEITAAGSLETTAIGSGVSLTTGADDGDVLLNGSMTALNQVAVTSAAGSVNGSGRMTASSVVLNAETGLGNTAVLKTSVSNLSAITTGGVIALENTLGSAVLVSSLVTGNGAVDLLQLGGGDLTFDVVSASTSATIENQAGSVTLDGTLSSESLSVTAAGDLTDGASGDISVDQLATLSAANITLGDSAGNATNFGSLIFNSTGAVALSEDSSMTVAGPSTAGGGLELSSSGDILLESIVDVTGATARLNAVGGIFDGEGTDATDLRAARVGLLGALIGDDLNPFDVVATSELNADTSHADGDIILANYFGDLPIGQFTAGSGDVTLIAGDDVLKVDAESLLVSDDLSILASNDLSDGNYSIDLATNVSDFEATVEGSNRGDIRIVERDTIRLASSDHLADEVVQTANGQIEIIATDGIYVMDYSVGDDGPDRKGDQELMARGANGRIDLEVVAEGGFIELDETVQLSAEKKTPNAIFDDPQSETSPSDLGLTREQRSVFIQSDSIRLGTEIEIFTGQDQGTARVFASRPLDLVPPGENQPFPDTDVVGDGDSAFFVASSMRTDTLEQATGNDARGTLSLDIGQAGERGLSMDIDWGAPSDSGQAGEPERFQRVDGLDADVPTFVDQNGGIVEGNVSPDARLTVEHLYSESDIVNSTANGRQSATDSLEVRFAVRHHASILVLGSDVQQGIAANEVEGGVVSSTDDPRTDPLLENGRATFIIPAISIPVAFFPVREVIPEIVTTDFVVRGESNIEFVQPTLESNEVLVAPTVGREEYFQIRVLSPDPDGGDLAVQRLPDDILDGDKIKNLLSRLPDGRYEIEYVLGDSANRTILKVDVRSGEATIPGESLDEGVLRLKEVQQELPLPKDDGPVELPQQDEDLPGENEAENSDQEELEEVPLGDPADQSSTPLSTNLIPLVGGYTVSSAWSRRKRSSRFSKASAYAKRWHQRTVS